MKYIYIIVYLSITLFADVSIEEKATILKESYPDKTTIQLKEMVLKKAKLSATKKIFGEFLSAETVVENGQVLQDRVRQRYAGVIHLVDKPKFTQTSNSISVVIKAYATDKDIQDVQPHKIVVDDFVYLNPSVTLKDLKESAQNAFIFESIKQKKPSVTNVDEAKYLALSVDIQQESFDLSTLTYHIKGAITYIPAFLNSYIPQNTTDSTKKHYESENFYGEWKGFLRDWNDTLLGTNKNASDITITITSFSEATIDYASLDCGGELLVVEKTKKTLLLKEVLIYGKDRCKANKSIFLKRLTPRSLEIILNNEGKKPFHSKVYLSE